MKPEALSHEHNLGDCRYDVLLTAKASAGSYWITAQPQSAEWVRTVYGAVLYHAVAAGAAQMPSGQHVSMFVITAEMMCCLQPMPQQNNLEEQISLSVLNG